MSKEPTPTPDPQPTREAAISPAMRQRLQQCFQRAQDLTHKDKPDFDYAHDLYAQCVINDPGNLVYVEALLDNLQRKYNNNRKGSRLRRFGSRKAFSEAVADKEWRDILREGMELLKSNPWDVSTLRELALGCAEHHHNEVELRYLKNALDAKPKDPEINRHCAQSLARMGQFDMAIACWNRVAEATKSDEPEKMISELTLAKTMGVTPSAQAMGLSGKRAPAQPAKAADGDQAPRPDGHDVQRAAESDSGEAGRRAEEAAEDASRERTPRREIKLNARQMLERAIRESPGEAENYLRLAELHAIDHRYHDAEEVLGQAIKAVGPSLRLQSALEDARIQSAKARLAIAEKRASRDKSDESHELARKLRDDLNRLELDVYQKRCQRFPEKRRLRYELGVRLRRAGNYQQAVNAYEEARHDPACLVAATLEMGECWQQLKQYGKARKCYELAIEKSSELDGDRRKLALYRGAVLASALRQSEQAKTWFQQLLELDPGYKDAAARLDKLSTIGHDV